MRGLRRLRNLWYLRNTVDRVSTLGRQVIIFPEGTRSDPGTRGRYHPGVAAMYKALPEHVPMVPMALNSGRHWGRRKFWITPGTITLEVLEPDLPRHGPQGVHEAFGRRGSRTPATRLLTAD